MDIQQFMQGYKRALENRDPAQFCAAPVLRYLECKAGSAAR
jgi:hypothetical protein